MCECVNIQYKRLEQLSGASPQTQPGFGFQLAAGGFRGPERHWWGGGSPALHASFTSPPEPCWEPHQPPPASPGPLQLAAFLPSQVQQECWSQIVWVMAVSEGTERSTRLSLSGFLTKTRILVTGTATALASARFSFFSRSLYS